MKNKLNVANMIKLGVILMIFAVAACVMLAFVYTGTSKIISISEANALQAALKDVFPDADGFTQGEGVKSPDTSVTILSAYRAEKGGETVGAALEVTRVGYDGPIRMMVGVGVEGNPAHRSGRTEVPLCIITGVKILKHSETPGLGANAASEKYFVDKGVTFYGQVAGKSVYDPFTVKGDVVAVTAATISSRAVTLAVKAAGLAAVAWLAEGVGVEVDLVTGATVGDGAFKEGATDGVWEVTNE
jgi:electron transport complex protein RnfG